MNEPIFLAEIQFLGLLGDKPHQNFVATSSYHFAVCQLQVNPVDSYTAKIYNNISNRYGFVNILLITFLNEPELIFTSKLRDWHLAIRLFSVISRRLIMREVLPFCRDAVGEFYSSSRLSFEVLFHLSTRQGKDVLYLLKGLLQP